MTAKGIQEAVDSTQPSAFHAIHPGFDAKELAYQAQPQPLTLIELWGGPHGHHLILRSDIHDAGRAEQLRSLG